jgi:hypothetical protein
MMAFPIMLNPYMHINLITGNGKLNVSGPTNGFPGRGWEILFNFKL